MGIFVLTLKGRCTSKQIKKKLLMQKIKKGLVESDMEGLFDVR